MTWVTVSCTVWAEAPGYMALMVICGGAIGGYWETGSVLIASRPASMTMMAITQAKIGRLMKKRGMKCLLYFFAAAGLRSSGGSCVRLAAKRHRLDRCSRARLLEPFQDHPVAGFQSFADQPVVANRPDDLDHPRLHLLFGSDHHDHGIAGRIAGDAALRHQDRLLVDPFLQDGADKHAGQQSLLRVGEDRPQGDGAGALVHGDFGEFQGARQRIGAAVLQQQLDLCLAGAVAFQQAAGQVLLQAQQLGAGLGDIHIDRI